MSIDSNKLIDLSKYTPIPEHSSIISKLKLKCIEKGLELLSILDITQSDIWDEKGEEKEKLYVGLQIATSESLTAGLIFSSLVDIPNYGYLKYGCFGVYDTDAKRVFNNVSVDDVYTHKCASEMAIGVLKNSNATIAIAVTGNAMPHNTHANMLGEVFIGIAGYNQDNEIIYITRSINACLETDLPDFKKLCDQWYNTIKADTTLKTFNPRQVTATVSQEIRYYTAYAALNTCLDFINSNELIVPEFVKERKRNNNNKSDNTDKHTSIPANKFTEGGVGICKNKDICHISGERTGTKIFQPNSATGGKRKTRRIKRKKL
jgi:nicotinamide mononucleotide (NMN) deamidase PncC